MAECIVEVCRIEKVFTHPNADALELAQIKGWQCVIPKGRYLAGDLVTYVPVDSVIPLEHSDRWNITKYLSKQRVRCARLRGEPSFGVIVDVEQPDWAEGQDVKEFYGIEKYIPPVRMSAGDSEPPHPLFPSYTDVENMRNFPDVFDEGEAVVVTEKIHGTNCRLGLVEGEWMAGSMEVRRKRPERMEGSIYWFPLTLSGVEAMLTALGGRYRQAVLFGEVYGSKIQSLHYGCKGTLGFRAFDLLLDGKYAETDDFLTLCGEFGVEAVPVLWRGPFSLGQIRALSEGSTTLGEDHIREGVVVKPVQERMHTKVGRLCLKYIGDQYLFAKDVTDSHDV
jgi:RNA ligase (TIGR02306 family)